MAALDVQIMDMEQQVIYGLWKNANDKTISKDIRDLAGRYGVITSLPEKERIPYFVLCRNYDEQSRGFELFIGGTENKGGLERFVLPAGTYAKVAVKPKLGFLWGVSIGEAKRAFYTKWLPGSPYKALDMEYESHTQRSVGKHPEIDLLFAVEKKR